jgi:hypothetical protein
MKEEFERLKDKKAIKERERKKFFLNKKIKFIYFYYLLFAIFKTQQKQE